MRLAFLQSLTEEEKAAKLYDWSFWARDKQLLPPGDWINWLPLAGRGWGKTRVGAEAVREWVRQGFHYVNLIGATVDDVRDIMVLGESGILAVCPADERPVYIANQRVLRWPNGAKSLLFSAEKPDQLRGKQHEKLWCDEVAAWRYADSWDQAMFGLRLGSKPQVVVTTTPRPTKLIKELVADPKTHVTVGSTYENRENLAEAFVRKVIAKYEGTRLGRQELNAEIIDAVEGALWSRAKLDEFRVRRLADVPPLRQVVVSIDPAATSGEDADETGIICAGVAENGHGYVLEDKSGRYMPNDWAKEAISLYHRWHANFIVGEVNNGGEMVENTIRMADPGVPFQPVHASRGKFIRAEPISLVYEQGRIHHVGVFGPLEDQMCIFTSDYDRTKMKFSPDRMDALVWAMTELAIENSPGSNLLEYFAQQDAETTT